MVDSTHIKGYRSFVFKNREELIQYATCNKGILIALNAEKILNEDPSFNHLVNENIGYADGIGAVWVLKKKGFKYAVKIPGCELWLDIVNSLCKEKTFYLVGSKQGIIDKTVDKLKKEYPGIRIVNYRNGYIKTLQEKKKLIQDILEKKPDVVFVAMGSPKQETLMQELQEVHPAIYQGLGGSFDVYVGIVKRAPDWWVNNNLEWAYRLINQPTRILRQWRLVKFFIMLQLGRY